MIDEVGTLIRDGGALYLRRGLDGRYELEQQRTPVDLVEKRLRIVGTLVAPLLVSTDGVAPAWAIGAIARRTSGAITPTPALICRNRDAARSKERQRSRAVVVA